LSLLSFTGTLLNSDVTLKWATSAEVNVSRFVVERSQGGSSAFAPIGSVAALSASGTNHYSYLDKGVSPGVYFYRLKMQDRDGQSTYSPVVAISSNSLTSQVILYPNPVTDRLFVQVAATGPEKMVLQLADMQGRVLQQQEVQLDRGVTAFSLNTASLGAGNYLLISAGERKVIGQFMKK